MNPRPPPDPMKAEPQALTSSLSPVTLLWLCAFCVPPRTCEE